MPVDVIIVGAGPAGIACAVQLKHQGVNFVLLESKWIGGLLVNANLVENMPLLPPLSGAEAVGLLKEKLKDLEIKVTYSTVTSIEKSGNVFNVTHSSGRLSARYVVIATGTVPKRIESFEVSPKVVYEPLELFSVSEKKIAIAGSGEAAFDSALSLSKSNRVTLFTKHSEFHISPHLHSRVAKNEKIVIMHSNPIKRVCEKGDKLLIMAGSFKDCYDNLLISIGRKANRRLLSPELLNDKRIFLAGDVKHGKLGQVAIALGNGIEVAQNIVSYLRNKT